MNRGTGLLFGMLLCHVQAITAGMQPVFDDTFEENSRQSPPAGWTMWGAERFKVPENFIRDTSNPHGGTACFRIRHPANTEGYIVASTDRALHPKPGMIYTVSFWARADKQGKALFGWTAYRTLRPFVEAPAPGTFPFEAGSEWKAYSFSVREGLDLLADDCRFLLLTFHAAAQAEEERTLWIDDVRVLETPDPDPVPLLDETTLPRETLQHRLQPGERLAFTVDASNRLRRATAEVGGVSFHRVCGWTGQPFDRRGTYTLAPELETAIRELRLPMTRFYALGDEPFGLEAAIDKVAETLQRVGAPQESCVLEFERQGAETRLAPEVWARGVSYSRQRGYAFHRWEIANEPYASSWGGGQAFPTADSFVEHFKAVARAIRAVDPKAQLGVDIHRDHVKWGNYLLKRLAGEYDFVAPHYYCGADLRKAPFEEIALTENYRMLDRVQQVNALLKAYNPHREVYQYDTEWGMICGAPDGKAADYEGRNANIVGTLHRAVRLIYYAREDLLRGASGWQMLSRLAAPGFGILSQEAPEKRFMLYWLYHAFNRHVGEWVLAIDGTAPYYEPQRHDDRARFSGPLTPVLATLSKDGRELYLVIANGSWTRTVPCRVRLSHFTAERSTGLLLSNGDLDGQPLLSQKSDALSDFPVAPQDGELAFDMPPHAVVFVRLQAIGIP